jgi:hypothetical protein
MRHGSDLGCQLACIRVCERFGPKVVRQSYAVWVVPPQRCLAVGGDPSGYLKAAAHMESKRLADLLVEQLTDG